MMLHEKIREIVERQRAKADADTLTLEEFQHNCRQLLDLTDAVEYLERHANGAQEVAAADLASGKQKIESAVEISPLYAMDAQELKDKIELPLSPENGAILLGGKT